MQNNCLVTKLKQAVDNNNLNILGMLTLKMNVPSGLANQYYNRLNLTYTSPITVKVSGGKNMYVYNKSTMQAGENIGSQATFTVPEGQPYTSTSLCFPETGNYTVYVEKAGLQDITSFPCAEVDFNELQFYAIKALWAESSKLTVKGNVSKLPSTLETLDFRTAIVSPAFTGETGDFSRLTSLTSLKLNNLKGIVGDIAELGKIGLTDMVVNNTSINGSLEGFVKNMVSVAGITTKTMTLNYLNTNNVITFNGVAINTNSGTLSWEPSSTPGKTVVTWNGDSVEIDNV